MPCASCPGIRTKIWFASDGSYRRAQIYLEGSDGLDRTVSDFGRWAVTPGDRIVLRSTDADVARFETIHSGKIRLLDVEGRHIDSELNYDLKFDTTGQAEFGPMAMSGMYTYFADAAIFKPCNMRRTIPVAMIERHVDLEKLYLRQREAPGSPLLVRVNARLEDQPAMEGDAMTESLVVTSVEDSFPGKSCLDHASLTDSLGWVLVELEGVPIERLDSTQIPDLTFAGGSVMGSTGCNSLKGPVEVTPDSLTFGALAMTRRACPDTLEATFVDMLGIVDAYRIYGNELDLLSRGLTPAVFRRQTP